MEPAGIPDQFMGASNAPHTLIVYSSPTCGHCVRFEEQVWPLLKARYVDSGRLKVSIRYIPNNAVDRAILLIADAGGVMRRNAALAHFRARRAEIAAAQDREKAVRAIAAELGVDSAAFDRAMNDTQRAQALQRLAQQADREFGITGTPSFFLDGKQIQYYGNIASFSRHLDQPGKR